ncbi:MAG: hypothetical protein IPN67_08330 [Bacteroidales bacterium]|nr:hypothetical protein [Bacteroidales bacterium]
MAEFLTREEIKTYYDKLLHKTGYIKTLKKNINDAKIEQILNYAREVYMESIIRIEREEGEFHPVTPIFSLHVPCQQIFLSCRMVLNSMPLLIEIS